MSSFLVIYFTFFSVIITFSYEVDQFTNRAQIPDDCTELLDKKVEEALSQTVNELNSHLINSKMNCCPAGPQRDQCLGVRKTEENERGQHYEVTNWWYGHKYTIHDKANALSPVYQKLNQKLVFGGSYDVNSASTRTIIEDYAWSDLPEKCRVEAPSVSKSIHKDQKFISAFIASLSGLEPEVLVGNHRIGIDKLGHSLAQGFLIMREQELNKTPAREAIDKQSAEDSLYGCSSTGIYSYGDVAANIAGADFWFDVFEGRPLSPIDSETQQPADVFIRCEDIGNGIFRYRRTSKSFSWSSYVTPAWDEGINCSTTCKPGTGTNYNWSPDKNFVPTCPLDETQCLQLGKDWSEGKLIISGVSKVCRDLYTRRSSIPSGPSKATSASKAQ